MDVYVLVVSTRYIFFMRFLLRSPDSGVDLVADRKYLRSLKCQKSELPRPDEGSGRRPVWLLLASA